MIKRKYFIDRYRIFIMKLLNLRIILGDLVVIVIFWDENFNIIHHDWKCWQMIVGCKMKSQFICYKKLCSEYFFTENINFG